MEKAQKGDLIRIVKAAEDCYSYGDIFEVTERGRVHDIGAYAIIGDGSEVFIFDDEYVIHRKAGEEDSEAYCDNCGLEEVSGDCAHCSEEYEPSKSQDAVNSPNHYTQGKFETIEIIEEITKGYSDGYVAYCVGNALKYLARAPFKHGEPSEDLSKAAKYLAFASEYLDAKSTQD